MPRPIPQPRRSELSEEDREAYDFAVSRQYPDATPGEERQLDPYHGGLLNSPPYSRLYELGGQTVRTASGYAPAERVLVDHVLSAEFGTNAFVEGFIAEGLIHGLRMEAMKAVRAHRDDDLTDDERFLVTYIRASVRGQVTDELWDQLVDRNGPRGAIEYTCFINYLLMTIRNIQAIVGPSMERTDEQVDRTFAEYESGARKPPPPRDPSLTGGDWLKSDSP
jgi:hypothetical protein